jgi:peptidoglycan/LPS O-acetylase OafA/YrhL
MSFVHPAFLIGVFLTAVLVCCALGAALPLSQQGGRYQTIDGLRGYLALAVFLHHAAIWHFFLVSGEWKAPPSNLYTHLGQTSVTFFFMITGFLFYGKLLDGGDSAIDWPKFLVARVLRLGPLYMVAITAMLILVFFESGGVMLDSVGYILRCIAHWLLFTMAGAPAVNHVDTSLLIAGVNWSLPYEWYFYLSLPLLAFARRTQVPWPFMVVAVAAVTFAFANKASVYFFVVFGGGIAAAYAARNQAFVRLARSRAASLLFLASIAIVVMSFPTAYDYLQLLVLTVAFALVASGADLFGLLRSRFSHVLGELTYSIYLLHGMLLFVTFKYVVGYDVARNMSAVSYWMLIFGLVPVLLMIAAAAFRTIELPGMRKVPAIMAMLRRTRHWFNILSARDPLLEPVNPDVIEPTRLWDNNREGKR